MPFQVYKEPFSKINFDEHINNVSADVKISIKPENTDTFKIGTVNYTVDKSTIAKSGVSYARYRLKIIKPKELKRNTSKKSY